MAKVIDELLIGVSVDADEREFNEVQSGFDQIKSSALSLGAVLAGGLSIDAILGKTNELAAEWDGTQYVWTRSRKPVKNNLMPPQ